MTEQRDPVNEIEQLIDELEAYAERTPWYWPNRIVIPDEDFFRITSRVRELLPAELAEAQATLTKRDLILRNAQEEHRRILDSAERRLQDLTSQDQVVVAAEQEAERILESALRQADELKRDALLYTIELLDDMEQQFQQTTVSIQKGREYLQSEVDEQVSQNLSGVEELSSGTAAPAEQATTD